MYIADGVREKTTEMKMKMENSSPCMLGWEGWSKMKQKKRKKKAEEKGILLIT